MVKCVICDKLEIGCTYQGVICREASLTCFSNFGNMSLSYLSRPLLVLLPPSKSQQFASGTTRFRLFFFPPLLPSCFFPALPFSFRVQEFCFQSFKFSITRVTRRVSWILVVFCFLIWLVVAWVCVLYDTSLSCTLIFWVVFCQLYSKF